MKILHYFDYSRIVTVIYNKQRQFSANMISLGSRSSLINHGKYVYIKLYLWEDKQVPVSTRATKNFTMDFQQSRLHWLSAFQLQPLNFHNAHSNIQVSSWKLSSNNTENKALICYFSANRQKDPHSSNTVVFDEWFGKKNKYKFKFETLLVFLVILYAPHQLQREKSKARLH